jgi:hypothetical protein
MRRRVFTRWAAPLTVFWVFANWPHHTGLGGFFYVGGFLFGYASGVMGKETHDLRLFVSDGLIGIVAVAGISVICAWSRRLPPAN